jgi:hypothetical protein
MASATDGVRATNSDPRGGNARGGTAAFVQYRPFRTPSHLRMS